MPEGETDWLASAFQELTTGQREFVSKASHAGLSEPELAALRGWQGWIQDLWAQYCATVGKPSGSPNEVIWSVPPPVTTGPTPGLLRRWAHTAKRSRWPLLRNVIAESLRAALEPQALDRVPLPTDHARLFELLCIVRVLHFLEPTPTHIRWVDARISNNEISCGSLSVKAQMYLHQADMLATHEFDHGLRQGVTAFGIRVPAYVDGWLPFDKPRAGFTGILLEAKSGSQGPAAAVYQLKCYRAALRQEVPGPLLVWGIAEEWQDRGIDVGAAAVIERGETDDLWVFSTADQIPEIMTALAFSVIEED